MKNFILTLIIYLICCVSYAQTKDTIITQSGLKYVQVRAGEGGRPKGGDKLKVAYTGKLMDGKIFDAAKSSKPYKFTLYNKEVIPGWDEGFALMSKGEKGVLIIPASLAYGKGGVKDPEDEGKYIIPPGATLLFEVELIDFR